MRLLIRLTFYLLSLQNLTSISGKEWSVISNQRRRIRDLSRLKEIPDRFRKSVSQLFVIQERSNHWRGALCISWNSTDSPLNRDHPHELSSRSIYSFIYPTYPRSMSRISLHLDRRKKTVSFNWNSMEKECSSSLTRIFFNETCLGYWSDIGWGKRLSFHYWKKWLNFKTALEYYLNTPQNVNISKLFILCFIIWNYMERWEIN